MWMDLVSQAENQPASERTEQMLGDGPGLLAVTTTQFVVSAESLMATSQIPLQSLGASDDPWGASQAAGVAVWQQITRFSMISLTSVTP